jgi:hypothetical protein
MRVLYRSLDECHRWSLLFHLKFDSAQKSSEAEETTIDVSLQGHVHGQRNRLDIPRGY